MTMHSWVGIVVVALTVAFLVYERYDNHRQRMRARPSDFAERVAAANEAARLRGIAFERHRQIREVEALNGPQSPE